MKKSVVLLAAVLFSLCGCKDFLEEESKELTYAQSCADLEELLVGDGYMKRVIKKDNSAINIQSAEASAAYFPWLQVLDDDVEEAVSGQERIGSALTKLRSFYNWEKDPCNVDMVFYDDPTWTRLYKHISVTNVILKKVDDFIGEEKEDIDRVKGQAYFLRAAYYFLLVNFYAKPYDPVSASTDLGVPLKLTEYIEESHFTRATVERVYWLIVSDLQRAITCLKGIKMPTFYRVNEDAARTFLSRVYCYMGKWEFVPELCRKVMDNFDYTLDDLTTGEKTSWMDIHSPEVIFSQGSNAVLSTFATCFKETEIGSFRISQELMNSFEANDYRLGLLCYKSGDYIFPRKTKVPDGSGDEDVGLAQTIFLSENFLIRLAEVYLNLAEALAMTGKEGEARDVLKQLMEKRIKPLGEITASGEELVELIRAERRRELCFEGHRWFDLRRYAVSPKYPNAKSIRHNVYDYNYSTNKLPGEFSGYYLLPAYPDGGWVLPIPSSEIEETNGSLANNQREDCLFYNE